MLVSEHDMKLRIIEIESRIDKIDIEKVREKVEKFNEWIETLNDEDWDVEENQDRLDIGSSLTQISGLYEIYKRSNNIDSEYMYAGLIGRELNYLDELNFNMAGITKEG